MINKTSSSLAFMSLFFISTFFMSCKKSSDNSASSSPESSLAKAMNSDFAKVGIVGHEFSPDNNAKLLEYSRPYTIKDEGTDDVTAEAHNIASPIDYENASDDEKRQRSDDLFKHVNDQIKTMHGSTLGPVKDGKVSLIPPKDGVRSDMKILDLMNNHIAASEPISDVNFSSFFSQDESGNLKVRSAGLFSWVSHAASKVSHAFQVAAKAVQKSFIKMYYDAKELAKMAAKEVYNVAQTMHAFYEKEKPYFEEAANLIKIFPNGTLTFIGSELVMDAFGGPASLAQFPAQLAGFFNAHKSEIEVNFEHLVSYEVLKYATKTGQRLCFNYIPENNNPSASDADKEAHFNKFTSKHSGACSVIKYGIKALQTVENIGKFIGLDKNDTSLCDVARKGLCQSMNKLKLISDSDAKSTCVENSGNAMTMDKYITSLIANPNNPALKAIVENGEEEASKNATLSNIWSYSRVVYTEVCQSLAGANKFLACDVSKRELCLKKKEEVDTNNDKRKEANQPLIKFDPYECALLSTDELVNKYESKYKELTDKITETCN